MVIFDPSWSTALKYTLWFPTFSLETGLILNIPNDIDAKFSKSFFQSIPSSLIWKVRVSPYLKSISSKILFKLNKWESFRVIFFWNSFIVPSDISVQPDGKFAINGSWFIFPISNWTSCSISPPRGSKAFISKEYIPTLSLLAFELNMPFSSKVSHSGRSP